MSLSTSYEHKFITNYGIEYHMIIDHDPVMLSHYKLTAKHIIFRYLHNAIKILDIKQP